MISQDKPSASISTPTFDHFCSIPWCRPLVSDTAFRQVEIYRGQTHSHAHTLFGSTWNTENTIPHLLTLYRPPSTGQDNRGEMRRFFTIGRGLNENTDILHGGAIAAMLDTALGKLVKAQELDGFPVFTLVLNITYKKAVRTPGTIMTRSWITKSEGRKFWAYSQIESGAGEIHATAEGMLLKRMPKI